MGGIRLTWLPPTPLLLVMPCKKAHLGFVTKRYQACRWYASQYAGCTASARRSLWRKPLAPRLPSPAAQFGGVVWLFRYPADVALSVGINLAQIGEFGFVLLSVAHQYGLVPSQVYMLLMGESWWGPLNSSHLL